MIDMDRCKRYILTRNGMYLMNSAADGVPLRYTSSAYSAAQYKSRKEAISKAKQYGAKLREFNPITGEVTYG